MNEKGYLTQHQDLTPYALKSEIPQPYNDSTLNERVTALESKAIEGGAYDDTDLRNRVINLENKPPLDTSEFVTNQALESRGYINDVSNFVTKEELTNKGYLTTHQSLDNVVTKEELATKGYITDVSNLVTKEELESKNYLTTPYNDTPLKERVEVLENKVDKDTVYNDTELRNRVEVLENKPTTGGTQTQDTGWLKVSGENAIAENIVEIRRIGNTVHVRFRNEKNGDFIIVENIYSILDKEISGGFGTVTNNSPIFSSKNNRELGRIITNVSNNRITVESSIDIELSGSKSVYINEFSYIADDPFPTNLH